MGLVTEDDGWRVPDALWERIEPLLPKGKPHPWGVCRPRVDDRRLLNGILFVLRTGCQWDALNATGIFRKSTAHDRYRDWKKAGVFEKLWAGALQEYDALKGIDWEWLAMDGALTKAPLGGEKNRAKSDGSGQKRHQTESFDRRPGRAVGRRSRRGEPERLQAGGGHLEGLGAPTAAGDAREAAGNVPG